MYSKENLENGHGDFTALLSTLQDQASRKIDFVADTVGLDFQTRGGATTVHAEQTGMATIATRCNDTAFGQVLAKADIDTRTGRRLQENYPDVLDLALNRIYSSESKSVMLRTFDSPADSNEPGELQ